MLEDHARILQAIDIAGTIAGRKKLQKMIYISKKLHFSFHEKFEFHYYGPYSEELTLQVDELTNMGFLEEVQEPKNGYKQYNYSLTQAGIDFLNLYGEKNSNVLLAHCLIDMNGQSARFLELVSTLFYFENMKKDEFINKIFTLKSEQHYTLEEIEEAYHYMEQLSEKAKPMQLN